METTTYRILIADDHDIVLRGMADIVRETLGPGTAIDTASRGCDVLKMAAHAQYDLCLLDISLPDIDGLGLLRLLRDSHRQMKIIVNTIHNELWYVREYVAAEVEGILFKSTDAREIADAVRAVVCGRTYRCREAKRMVRIIEGYNAPTSKEMETLRLIASGKSTTAIAEIMGVTANTIETHRRRLLEKLNAKNVAELMVNAIAQGLIAVPKQ